MKGRVRPKLFVAECTDHCDFSCWVFVILETKPSQICVIRPVGVRAHETPVMCEEALFESGDLRV